ncbi:MAG TPA: choice-of-anchor Q domain-containing protein [Candidatus Acidoferrales bacterium]|jgi:hypothetical protein|nr:choice-of-anchor Q domain-containing protein [Candidatus Acidoferrales bacterium]
MNCSHGHRPTAIRSLAFLVAASLFAGCSGASRLLPGAPVPGSAPVDGAGAGASMRGPGGDRVTVRMSIRIPERDRRTHDRHPATISALTQSVGIAIDGGAAKVFNTTPTSPGCTVGAKGTTCTFAIAARVGTDRFVATTYSATGGGGSALDRGVATVPIVKGKANTVAVTLGPVVTTTADTGVGSLRYAVATANFGDTIMFLLPSGSTIALASPIVIEGNVTIAGPGAATPITIAGGNAHQLFFVVGAATISGLTLTQGKAPATSAPGGAIANTGALTLAGDTFNGNSSVSAVRRGHKPHIRIDFRRRPHCTSTTNEGGALYNAGTLVITGTTFNGNVVVNDAGNCIEGAGGAIYNDETGTISSNGDTFTNNAAMDGGAVFNAGIGQATFTNDTFSGNQGCTAATGCPTSGCTSTGCTSFASGVGAAIFDEGGATITSSKFTNNVAGGVSDGSTGLGGAVALAAGNPTITGSVFTANLAGGGTASCSTGQGGAIYAAVPLVLTNDAFTSNRAAGDSGGTGGAVVAAAALQASGTTFKSNQAVGSGSACTPASQAIGGAVYGVAATLTGDTFTSNAAIAGGTSGAGAVGCLQCYLTGNTFTSNAAIGTGAASAPSVTAAGGALYGQATVKLLNNTFTSNSSSIAGPNSAEAYGGAVVVTTGPVASSGDVFTSNSVKETVGAGTAAGGAIVMTSGTAIMTHDTFTSNTASSSGIAGGGAGYMEATLVLSNTTISQNHATGGSEGLGGGFAGSTGQFIHDAFAQNTAGAGTGTGAGGGLYSQGSSEIESTTFSKNTASAVGGGLLLGGGDTLIDTTIAGNVVTAATTTHLGGGGLFASGSVDIEQSTIANNAVTIGSAGGIGGGGIYSNSPLTLEYSTVSGNVVLGSGATSGGGGIYSGGTVTMQNSTISNNISKDDGGGLYIGANATVTIQNVTLFKNAATGSGGNIINPFAMTLTNSIVAGGTASSGADIKNTGTLTSGDYNIIQTAVAGNAPTGTTTHNKTVDPLLLALSNNGGATFTNADGSTSPGKAYIPYSGGSCGSVTLATDQRNYARGAGGHCDVGAFELGGVPSAARRPVRHQPAASGTGANAALHLRPIRLHPIQMSRVL